MGFEPTCRFRQTDFESLKLRGQEGFGGAFGCLVERGKWRGGAGLRAMERVGRGFGENASTSMFLGYLLARC